MASVLGLFCTGTSHGSAGQEKDDAGKVEEEIVQIACVLGIFCPGSGNGPSEDEEQEGVEGPPRVEEDTVPLTPNALDEVMDSLSAERSDWDGQRFRRVKQLQEAQRNHGCVELMAEGGNFVAVKKMPTRWVRKSPKEFKEAFPESSERPWLDAGIVRHLNAIRFPYAVKLIGMFADSDNTYVVSSLATEGDLFAWCDRDPKPGVQREAAMYPLARQIFTGVRWLHDIGVAHRDLSLENILLHKESDGLGIKIIDFGMCTLDRYVTAELCGKQSYQAPELHRAAPFDTFMTDPFSLGVVLFAMGAQDYPWSSTKRKTCELFEYVCMFGFRKFLNKRRLRKGGGESLAEVFSPTFAELLTGLLAKDPATRLTLGEKCFASKDDETPGRQSVWDCQWLKQKPRARREHRSC